MSRPACCRAIAAAASADWRPPAAITQRPVVAVFLVAVPGGLLLKMENLMKILLLLLFCLAGSTTGVAYCEDWWQTISQYAFFASLIAAAGVLLTGAAD